MESVEILFKGNRSSFRKMPSKTPLLFSVIEIIALKDKLLFDKISKTVTLSSVQPENILT